MALSVIGAGLGRTGTLSLKLALQQLGVGRCYHMMEVFGLPAAPGQWSAAADGATMNWDEVFEGFGATVDWPSAEFYAELADYYPDAKVILTTRPSEAWFKSTQATIFNPDTHQGAPSHFTDMIGKVIGRKFGGRLHDHDHCIAVYEAHNEQVRRTVPAERLLEFNASEGWAPLCAFLGLPVPQTPYPSVNSTEEFVGRRAARTPA